ncbi:MULTISPECIES: EF-P 5-aminopentanol modification-associated protein YfmH [Aeribacillus]|uniref:Peptidase M16 n=1 Tax=Aeribacillus pallidus TaxID=33936 RepID=A0A223E898_9BACI|nr:pitrilysin family protein [Aeribacillus pallidus]ASS91497.1 peptidase M16 [Aeribacillus pallidus]
MIKEITFDQLKETYYYKKMENGLDVYVLPKQGIHKTYATFTTKYGSIDNKFVPIGKEEIVHVPDGIAHFLEHKLFEKKDGDVFQQFSEQGASANAFTSFTRTAYLFSSTANVEKNLETLVDFVQSPYFTDQSVEKEKGIIGQEINMYQDNPDWRLYFGLIQNMYESHPVRIDIAGTIDSINQITKEQLYECYETFYHPSNMLLFVIGPVQPEKIIKQVEENQAKKDFKKPTNIVREQIQERDEVFKTSEKIYMNVKSSKCLVGLKAKHPFRKGEELLTHELSMNLILEMLFGKSSKLYLELYEKGLIDDTFSFDYTEEYSFGFAMVGGDTDRPDELSEYIKEALMKSKQSLFTDEQLEAAKKKKIGSFLRAFNSPEFIANQFTRYQFNEMNLFDVVQALENVNMDTIEAVLKEAIDEDYLTVFQVLPKS